MEREAYNDTDEHTIDIITDDDSSTGSSLDDESYSSSISSLSTDEERAEAREGSSSSTSGCNCLWNSVELVVTLVKIVAALVVLTLAEEEHPQALLLAWLIGYTCGCTTRMLLILPWCFRKYNQVGEHSRTRMDEVMEVLKIGVECFFLVWLLLGIAWICNGHSSPYSAPKLYRLCKVFIACGCIRDAYIIISCADFVGEGLGGGFFVLRPNPDDCCCICLGKYGEEGEIVSKLECSHVFHLKCIDKWLKIKATCPLCQSLVMG